MALCRHLLAAVLTAGLLWACHFPLACGWLAWVALVPLLTLVRAEVRQRRVLGCAWVGGLVFFVSALQWMRVADLRMYATWLALAVYCSLYIPAALLIVRRLDRRTRLPLVLTLPVVWTALEFVRAHLMTGFAWYCLGHTQHDFLAVAQVADLGGAYAVSFLVAIVNAWAFEALAAWAPFRRWAGLRDRPRVAWAAQTAVVTLLLAAALGYGAWRLGQDAGAAGPRVALLQGDLDQRLRNEASEGDAAAQAVVKHYVGLANQAAAGRPDLIVWPETSWPGDWVEAPPGTPDADSRWLAAELARRFGTNVLIGANARVTPADGKPARYNSAVLIAGGRPAGRYDKMHRVPFGEYVPLQDILPWMASFAPYDFDYSIRPGERLERFPLGPYRFGVLICFEDTDPDLARAYVAGDEPRADFLLNISNDGWFDGTSEHEEHLAVCRFRAIESRRAVARAVNMGISAVIDGNGRVLNPGRRTTASDGTALWEVAAGGPALPVGRWGEFKKVPGVLTAVIPIDGRASLYARWGDWLPWSCWIVLGTALVASLIRRPRPAAA